MTLRIFDEEFLPVLAMFEPSGPIWTMSGPFASQIVHMDHGSSIWMIYHAAADAAATIGEMYLKENIFEKKMS